MIKIVLTYIQQRFKMQMYLPLALLLVLFGMKDYSLNLNDWMQRFLLLPFILMFLLGFRIFDDLVSRKEDQDHSDRIYTEKRGLLSLQLFLCLVFIIGLLTVQQSFETYVLNYLIVIGLSLLPYVFRGILPQLNFIYPLFKYGLIVLFMNDINGEIEVFDYVFSGIIFIGFITYEILEDNRLHSFKPHIKWLFWLMIIPFWFSFPNQLILLVIIPLIIYLIWLFRKPQFMHYYILLLLCSLKIIVYVV